MQRDLRKIEMLLLYLLSYKEATQTTCEEK